MKKIPILLLVVIFGSSCSKELTSNYKTIQNTNTDTLQFVSIPTFPASVVHVLHREYVLANPDVELTSELMNQDYKDHMETRLYQLFPDAAFSGLMDYTDGILGPIIEGFGSYEDSIDIYDSDTIPNFYSEQSGMNLDSTESYEWMAFDSLAIRWPNNPATLSEILSLDSTMAYNKTQVNWCNVGYAYFLSRIASPWAAFRVWQSIQRAYDRESLYYGGNTGNTEGDAYRHIVWNLLMRRYVGNTIAWATSGANELCGGNNCAGSQMDFHNNYIGRIVKYEAFRDRWNTSPWAWQTWCDNAYVWVHNSSNGIYKGGYWTNAGGTPIISCSAIRTDQKNTSDNKYIYLKQ